MKTQKNPTEWSTSFNFMSFSTDLKNNTSCSPPSCKQNYSMFNFLKLIFLKSYLKSVIMRIVFKVGAAKRRKFMAKSHQMFAKMKLLIVWLLVWLRRSSKIMRYYAWKWFCVTFALIFPTISLFSKCRREHHIFFFGRETSNDV